MRFIKTQYVTYVKIPENDDSLLFTYEEVGDGFLELLMSYDNDGKTVWLTRTYAKDEDYIKAVLDKLIMFVIDDEFDIVDMDVIVELASDTREFVVEGFEF